MRSQTGINAIDHIFGPTPAPKKAIDLRPKPKPAYAPNAQLTPGRGGRRHMPRPGEGVKETAQMAYNFWEPGYVHATRTGTVPESALGKGLLGLETALDFTGAGKVAGPLLGMLPFGFMKKVDPVDIQRKTMNIKQQIDPDDYSDATLEKYIPDEIMLQRTPQESLQKGIIEAQNLNNLVRGSTKKEVKRWREAVKNLPPEQRQGFPIHNIDTMRPTDIRTRSILRDQIGDLPDLEELLKNPNFPLFDISARAAGNIEKARDNIIQKVHGGQIERTVGHKAKSQLVKDYVAAEADRQAHMKAIPQVRNKAKEIYRESYDETKRLTNKYEADEVNRLYEEHAFGRGYGEESAQEFLGEFHADAAESARHFGAEEFAEQLNARTEAKARQTVQRSIPAQRKEIKNQLQEKGTYDPKDRMKKGEGEDAEAIRQMQKMLQSYNPMDMRIRSV